jgi:hypothetical protein
VLAAEVQRVAVEVVHVRLPQVRLAGGVDAVALLIAELQIERAQALA